MSEIRLIHFADVHLGFTGPTNLVLTKAENAGAAGRYVREVDIEESVKRMTRDLVHAQPAVDMVVIAGDLFHRSVPYPRAISFAAKMIRLLRNYDIPVVIIDGNHETANILLMGSPTAFLRELKERLREHLEEFKKHFFEANTEEIMRRTTELLMHAITDQSILGVKFDRDEFQYLDASYSTRPVGRLSGGEKALVGLCLRIALAEQAQIITKRGRVKFLVLDEVLSALDDERSEAVKRIFDDVLQRGIFDHIVMITHLDTVKQSWHANELSVQKLDGKMSTVISVSPGEVALDLTEEMEV